MRFSEVAAVIESATPFAIIEMHMVPQGMVAVITAKTPDGKDANATLYLGEEQLAQDVLIIKLATDASEALQRYVDSFVPVLPPKWDEQIWGP